MQLHAMRHTSVVRFSCKRHTVFEISGRVRQQSDSCNAWDSVSESQNRKAEILVCTDVDNAIAVGFAATSILIDVIMAKELFFRI